MKIFLKATFLVLIMLALVGGVLLVAEFAPVWAFPTLAGLAVLYILAYALLDRENPW